MRQVLFFLSVLFFSLFSSYAEEGSDPQVVIDGITYSISGDSASIINCVPEKSGVLEVASISYNEKIYPVVTIGFKSFMRCSKLTSVSFPEVSIIGNGAFNYCEGITSVSLPKVTNISQAAFSSCNNLESISLPQIAPIIKEGTFATDKSNITIYVNGIEEESEGYTGEKFYFGFKDIVYSGTPAGINPNEVSDLKAYVDENGSLYIDGIDDTTKVYVYNTMGNLISKSNKQNIDVQLRTGVYFVKAGPESVKVIAK